MINYKITSFLIKVVIKVIMYNISIYKKMLFLKHQIEIKSNKQLLSTRERVMVNTPAVMFRVSKLNRGRNISRDMTNFIV